MKGVSKGPVSARKSCLAANLQYSVYHSIGIAKESAALPHRKLIHQRGDPAMFAGPTDVAVVPRRLYWFIASPVISPSKPERATIPCPRGCAPKSTWIVT